MNLFNSRPRVTRPAECRSEKWRISCIAEVRLLDPRRRGNSLVFQRQERENRRPFSPHSAILSGLAGVLAVKCPNSSERLGEASTSKEQLRKILPRIGIGVINALFFDNSVDGLFHPIVGNAGNPAKIGDGCATVTGYKRPTPLVPRNGTGKAGKRSETRKSGHQLCLCSSGRKVSGHFSAKEKDEASP